MQCFGGPYWVVQLGDTHEHIHEPDSLGATFYPPFICSNTAVSNICSVSQTDLHCVYAQSQINVNCLIWHPCVMQSESFPHFFITFWLISPIKWKTLHNNERQGFQWALLPLNFYARRTGLCLCPLKIPYKIA